MLKVFSTYGIEDYEDDLIELDKKIINKAAASAIAAIKEELPEEAQTVEVVEYIMSDVQQMLKSKK